MKRWLASAAAAALLLIAPAGARTPEAAQGAISPALYVVRDEDSALYLFGTVHIRRPGSPWAGANAERALEQSEEVWTEIEMSEGADMRAAALMMREGLAPADQPLSGLLTAEENARLASMAQSLGFSAAMLERMRPWFAALMLSVWPIVQAGYDPAAGVDRTIDQIADAAGKRRRALETMEQQVGFLAGMSMDAQMQMLREALAQPQKSPTAMIDAMGAAWEIGDVEALERYVIDDTRENYPEVYEVMFVQRNNAWMEVLAAELEGEGVDFVAVGAGHLLGEHGLVAQFRARGYDIERVSPAE